MGVEVRFKLSEQACWYLSGELLKVFDHVHLIEVAQPIGYICPGVGSRKRFAFESGFESGDSRIELGRKPDLAGKSPLELSSAHARSLRESRDVDGTSPVEDGHGSHCDSVGTRQGRGTAEKKCIRDKNTFFEGLTLSETLLQIMNPGAKDAPRIMVRVRQFVHRQREHAMQSRRLKEDDK